MDYHKCIGKRVEFKGSVVVDDTEVPAGLHVEPYLGRVFRISNITRSWHSNRVYVKLEGDDAPASWIDVEMLDFVYDSYEEFDSFTDEDRDHYDRAFKSLFLNA